VLCALLAIEGEDFEGGRGTWRVVVRELGGLTRILGEFMRELTRTLDNEQRTSPQPSHIRMSAWS